MGHPRLESLWIVPSAPFRQWLPCVTRVIHEELLRSPCRSRQRTNAGLAETYPSPPDPPTVAAYRRSRNPAGRESISLEHCTLNCYVTLLLTVPPLGVNRTLFNSCLQRPKPGRSSFLPFSIGLRGLRATSEASCALRAD